MASRAKPKRPRNADLPAGTKVFVELAREEWIPPISENTVRQQLRGTLGKPPWCDEAGAWWAHVDGATYPLARVRARPGQAPKKPPKKLPTIPVETLEARAREVFGDDFVRLVVKPRVGRSETVTVHIGPVPPEDRDKLDNGFKGQDHSSMLRMQHDRPRGNPDAARKAFLDFLDSCTKTAKKIVDDKLRAEGAVDPW